jgi:WD40 repeat protein
MIMKTANPASGLVRRQDYGVAFSPDGKVVATADADGSAYLWKINS